ncbi:2107_t:CDS:2, partial [Dentiscutata erythropus]
MVGKWPVGEITVWKSYFFYGHNNGGSEGRYHQIEIAKIKLFTDVGSPYQLTISMEYVYLAVSLILPSRLWTLLWLSISVLYTLFTRDDIGGAPFYCPSNVTYNSTEFYVACKIRAANFVSMWLFAILAIMLMVTIPAGIFPHDDTEREMIKDKQIDVLGLWTNCDPDPDYL